MKIKISKFFLAGSILALSSTAIAAIDINNNTEQTTNSTTDIATLLNNLYKAGYSTIDEVKFDHGKYKVEVITNTGHKVKFYVTNINNIPSVDSIPKTITMLDAVNKAQDAGYNNIYKVDIDDDSYEINYLDNKKSKSTIYVNPINGNISAHESDN